MADVTKTVGVRLQADTKRYQTAMQNALGPKSVLGRLGVMAAGATAAAGAAVAAFAGASVREFASLEKGMNEVFTLMPGMSEDAMGDMTDDVQAFAREMGVLPDEVVPALYDAISAGVPKDTVFDFLATANELAVGGVSDLNTAVDGLSSSVNAYGEETLSADEAADIMFTGVKQGKTTIDELARTVSETAPIAASLGVGFDETTSALAAMTSQGEPSKRAATKLRQAMVELGDAGSIAGKKFEEVAGESFPEFIEGGGTLQEALLMMGDQADKEGKRIGDLFGSVEAGMAATMLTSTTGAKAVAENMTEMGNSAGAAEAAYAQMDQGIARTWERMRASLASFMTDIGERMGPGVTRILSGALASFNKFADSTLAFLDKISENWNGSWESIAGDTDSTVGRILAIAQTLWEGVTAAFDIVVAAWQNVLKPMWEAIAPAVKMNVDMMLSVAETALNAVVSLLEMVAALLRGDFSGAWEAARDLVTGVLDGILDRVRIWWTGVRDTFKALITFVNNQLDRVFGDLLGMSTTTFDSIGETVDGWWKGMLGVMQRIAPKMVGEVADTWDTMSRNITEAVQNDRTFLSGAWDGISELAERKWPRTTAAVTNAFDTMSIMIEEAVENDRTFISGVWDGIVRIAEETWPHTTAAISNALGATTMALHSMWNAMSTWLDELWQRIRGNADRIWTAIRGVIEGSLDGLAEWAGGIFSDVVDRIGGLVDSVVSRIQDAWDRVTALFSRADAAEERARSAAEEVQDQLDAAEASASTGGATAGGSDETAPSTGGGGSGGGRSAPDLDEDIMTPEDLADRGGLPEFAQGGLVMGDTVARIGEAGPEAVLPLDRLDGMLGGRPMTVVIELDRREVARMVAPALVDDLRLRTGLSGL